SAFSARTEDSRPGPGPRICTSRFLMPHSWAARPAVSAATCAANGVDLREPLKPAPPDDAHDSALPCRSVIVMIVLLHDAWMCAMPSETFFLAFLRARDAAAAAAADCPLVAMTQEPPITSSVPRRPCAGPCACVRWCACADRGPAGRGDDARRGSSPGPSGA